MWFLIILGLFARLWQFSKIPISLYWDEVAIGLDARSLLVTGRDLNNNHWLQALFYSYGDYKAPVYIWLTTTFSKFFSVSELTVRLPSLLASLATAFLFYKLIKLVSSKKSKLALYSLISFLIMPWSIHFAKIGMESNLSLFWLILSTYLIIYSAKKNKPFYLLFAALASSLGIYSYISLRIIAPILFISTFTIYHFNFSKFKSRLFPLLFSLVIMLLSLIVLTKSPGYSASQIYRLSNDNLIRSTTYIDKSVKALKDNEFSLSARIFHHRYLYKTREYLANYAQYFGPKFLFLSGDPNFRHHSGFGGQLLYIQGIFLIIGLLSLIKYSKKEIILLLTWLLLSPAIAALVNETPHASRSIYMIIPLAWLIGLGIDWSFKNIKSKLKPALSFIIIFSLSLNLILYLHDYFSHYPQRSAFAWLNPYKQSALYLKNNPTDKKVYVTGQFYQPWLYFSFYADIDKDKLNFNLPASCPENSLCIVTPDWQTEKTDTITEIPNTDELVVKVNSNEK